MSTTAIGALIQHDASHHHKIGLDRSVLIHRLVVDLGFNISSQKEYNKLGGGYLLLLIKEVSKHGSKNW